MERWVDWEESLISCVIAALCFIVQLALFPCLTKINEVAACHFKICACICDSFACLCQLSIMLYIVQHSYQLNWGNLSMFLWGRLSNLQVQTLGYWNVLKIALSMLRGAVLRLHGWLTSVFVYFIQFVCSKFYISPFKSVLFCSNPCSIPFALKLGKQALRLNLFCSSSCLQINMQKQTRRQHIYYDGLKVKLFLQMQSIQYPWWNEKPYPLNKFQYWPKEKSLSSGHVIVTVYATI